MEADTSQNSENCPEQNTPIDFDEFTADSLVILREIVSILFKQFFWVLLVLCRLLNISIIKLQLIVHVIILFMKENDLIVPYLFPNQEPNPFQEVKKVRFKFYIGNRLHQINFVILTYYIYNLHKDIVDDISLIYSKWFLSICGS